MAITRIHPIKSTLSKSIKYICNPEKTQEEILINSFACSPETAHHGFKFVLDKAKSTEKNNLAFHLIQSFAPGEVSHEEAHRIGIELAEKLLDGKYSYVIATHTDKGHVHNHIIFCAVSNREHKRYYDNKKSYYHIRNISDSICREHGLSVIENPSGKSKSYLEWKMENEGQSWKSLIKEDINSTIAISSSYEEFLSILRAKGYEIKGTGIGEDNLKYISFRAPGRERFVRGSERSLGANFTREALQKAFEDRNAAPKPRDLSKRIHDRNSLINTNDDKFKRSPGLKRWADRENLKTAAKIYAEAGSIKELSDRLTKISENISDTRSQIVSLDHQIKNMSELLTYGEQFSANKVFHHRYKKSKDPDRYMQNHEMELMLYDAAKRKLKSMGISLKGFDIDKIRDDLETLTLERNSLKATYNTLQKEERSLNSKLNTLTEFMGKDEPEIAKDSKKKTRGQAL